MVLDLILKIATIRINNKCEIGSGQAPCILHLMLTPLLEVPTLIMPILQKEKLRLRGVMEDV